MWENVSVLRVLLQVGGSIRSCGCLVLNYLINSFSVVIHKLCRKLGAIQLLFPPPPPTSCC